MAEQTPINFIFVDAGKRDDNQLKQGDLLLKTPQLASALGEAHPYYATAEDYSHFLVLTQSCDLVRRDGPCKSRYISIAAVRPLRTATSRELEKLARGNVSGLPFAIGDSSRLILARQYLDRIINNTVDGIFFIPKYSTDTVDTHLAAFLHLSVALRRDHYEVCLSSKVGQMNEIFAAKVGALLGDLYNRIATPDLHEQAESAEVVQVFKEDFYREVGLSDMVWLSDEQIRNLKKRVKDAKKDNPDAELDQDSAKQLLQDLPTERDALAKRALDVLVKRKLIELDAQKFEEAKGFLINDPTFQRLSKR